MSWAGGLGCWAGVGWADGLMGWWAGGLVGWLAVIYEPTWVRDLGVGFSMIFPRFFQAFTLLFPVVFSYANVFY